MKRVRRLDTVIFTMNAMYVEQEFQPNTYLAETIKAADGTNIEYYAIDHNPELTLDSMNYSLLSDSDRAAIIALYNTPAEYELQYVDGTTETVTFRLDKPPEFTELSEGSCLYRGVIYLTRSA